MSLQCFDCHANIVKTGSRGPSPKRCPECRRAFKAKSNRSRTLVAKHCHTCKKCGNGFCSTRKRQPFCSYVCMHLGQRKRVLVCCGDPACNKPIEATPSRLAKGKAYCSSKCAEARYPPKLVCQNPKCGREFRMKHVTKSPWQNKGKYCCPECYRDHRWGSHRPRRKTKSKDLRAAANSALKTSLRKRCKVFNVTFDPACTRELVLDRDRWICQKCRCLCNKEYRRDAVTKKPHSRNAEHDHIIPLSVKGSLGNVFENSQCLCRECNCKKRDRAEGQLRLCLEEGAWGKGVRVRSQQNLESSVGIQASGRSKTASRSLPLTAL
jgi:hypothetical protein